MSGKKKKSDRPVPDREFVSAPVIVENQRDLVIPGCRRWGEEEKKKSVKIIWVVTSLSQRGQTVAMI